MKKLNIRNKEVHILVLFGLLALLFVSVNLAKNYFPQGNYIFDDELPRSAAISINIVSPTANDNFSSTPPDFVVEIDDAVNPIDTMWYTIDGGATNITFLTNGTIDQNNWTALADGPVTLTFYANNSISEIDSASRSINKDTGAPVVTVTSPTGGDYFDATAPAYIVEISDTDSSIDTMWYTIDGGITNITFITNGTIDQNNWTALGDGPVTIMFYANDSAGNLDSDSVIINKDATDPTVSITSPTGGEYYDASAPSFTVEIVEVNLDTMWYTINGGVTNITFLTNGTIDQNNWTALGDGPVTIAFYANDSAGNIGSDSKIVNKDTGNPIVTISSPTGGEYFDATAPAYIVEISDTGSPIDTMWYTIDGGVTNITFLTNGTINQVEWTALGDGPVTIAFYANDSIGNIGSDSKIVNKDTGDPTVSITSPTGGEYFDATAPAYIVEISDTGSPIDTMWYTIDGGVTNITFLANGTIDQNNWTALVDGIITMVFYANDSAGNVNSNTVIVNKDATDPTVFITSPTGGQYFDATAPSFTVEITDDNLDKMWYTIDGGANIMFTLNGSIDQNNWTLLADGSVTIIFYANDSAGNVNSDTVNVNKDTTAPTLNIVSPLLGQTFGAAAPNFIVEIDDDILDTMWYTIDGGVTNITFLTNGTIDQVEWTALANGPVIITFYANDSFGHMNFASRNFNKNAEAPNINVVSPTSDSYFGISAPNFIVEITDGDLDTMWYTIDGGVTNITFTVNGTIDQNNWTAHIDGAVTLIFYANDSVGNFASELVLINKDTVAPTVNIISPSLLQLLGINSPSFIVEIDDPILDAMWYSLDMGLTNYTFMANGTFNPSAWGSVANGTVTIYFYANDLVGNEAFDSVVVRVDKIIPTITVNLPLDGSVIGTRPIINITVNDTNVDSIWYSVDSNIMALANNSDQLLNLLIWNALPEGPFTIELYANDTAGNLNNFYTINLIKDISAPIVSIVHPLPNATYSSNSPQITLTINDATLDTTWYSIVATSYTFEFTATIGTNVITINQAAWNSLLNGPVTIEFYANDSLGRISSDNITVIRNAPLITIELPLPDATYGSSAPQITLTINDATLDTTWYSIVGTNYTFVFTANNGTNVITINQTAWDSLSNGPVTIVFYANDSLGRISSDSIALNKEVTEVFDLWSELIAFLLSPIGLTIIGSVIAIVVIAIILKRRKTHRTSDKEVRKIESLWD